MSPVERTASSRAADIPPSAHTFYPAATVKCEGSQRYRSQVARDVACLLDVDPTVVSWRCNSTPFLCSSGYRAPDFEVIYTDGSTRFVDSPDCADHFDETLQQSIATAVGASYALLSLNDVYDGFRLQNAKDLLRYGNFAAPLGDRLRLLGGLDDHGSMTLTECLRAFQESRPVPGLASLILRGYVEVDLDGAPLGPETVVRRIGH